MNFWKKFAHVTLSGLLVFPSLAHSQTTPDAKVDAQVTVTDEEEGPVKTQAREGVKLYDLSQAIQQALTISPSIDSAKADLEISEAQLEEANNIRFLPQIDLKVLGGYVPDVPPGSGPEGNFPPVQFSWAHLGPFVQVRADAFQPIYTFGKISNLRKAALLGVDAKEEGVDKARNELVYQVKRAYIGLTSLYSFREFITELQSRALKANEVIQKQIQQKSSEVTDIDLMRVQVFQAETERRLVDINNTIQFTTLTLKVLMGLPRDTVIDIADQKLRMDDTVIESADAYLQTARENRPEIVQLRKLVEIRQAAMNGTKAGFYPSFGILGFYRYGFAPDRESVENPFLVDEFNQNSGGAFLGLTQNLSLHVTHAKYRQAKAQYDKAAADEQRALQGIEIEIRKAYSNAVSKQQSVESAKRGYKIGRSLVLATTLNFGIGVGPPKDLLEAFVAYSTVRINYLQTLNDYFMALADLSNAVGKEVTKLKY